MKLLDLFSGIGGFSLGLERAGFSTVAFCEIEPFCQRVLRKHWPHTPIYDDIRNLDAARLRADGIEQIDAICGGFPCQDISVAGRGAGLDGERSGLWREYSRLVGELRPKYVIVENVGALRARGLARVLGDFASFGYDAQWHVIPAAAVGAPHLRERVWIAAERDASNPNSTGLRNEQGRVCGTRGSASATVVEHDGSARTPANAAGLGLRASGGGGNMDRGQAGPVSDGLGHGHEGWPATDTTSAGLSQRSGLQRRIARALAAVATPWQWTAEPAFRRVDDASTKRLDRAALKALGNAVVPDIPEAIGRALLEAA